jgi:uncharacterized paraquat-inducible protein A
MQIVQFRNQRLQRIPGRPLPSLEFHSKAGMSIALRCPQCNKLLAKCTVSGSLEIACPRCRAMVISHFR